MTKTFDCVECGASAPYGRLSCPSCGALLVSVTGGRKPAVRVSKVAFAAVPEMALEQAAVAVAAPQAIAGPANTARTTTTRKRGVPAPPPFSDVAEPPPAEAVTASPPALVASAPPAESPRSAPAPTAHVPGMAAPPPDSADLAPATATAPATHAASAQAAATPPGPRTPHYAPTPAARARTVAQPPPAPVAADDVPLSPVALPVPTRPEAERAAIVPLLEPSVIASLPSTPWAPLEEPSPTLKGRPYQRHLATEPDPVGYRPPVPSTYRPPSQAMAMAMAAPAGGNGSDLASVSPEVSATAGAQATVAKHANRLFDAFSDPTRYVEIAGWFVVVGSTMSLLGFLLPWSRVVIGASAVGGYFDGWGLASPTHLVVFIGLLAVLALGILRDPVPAWISSGILGIAFGGLLLGLAWPYLVGPLGADIGLTMTTLGAVAMLIGGVVTLAATRHVAVDPHV